jgi:hypothetical protein
MVEKMTAVWLIILTIIVCASVPALLIWLTTMPPPKMLVGIDHFLVNTTVAFIVSLNVYMHNDHYQTLES